MFSPAVLDHFEHPRNAGTLVDAMVCVEVANPACGDELQLAANAASGRISAVRFRARGCVTSMACASLLTERMEGSSHDELARITPEQLSEALGGLPPATFHAAQLACDALAALLEKLNF
jgi:nitrogen fixation protein NifU and related proteins